MPKTKQTISFRIDSDLEYELAFIKKSLNLNLSHAIKDAIHSKYLQIQEAASKKTPGDILEASGFIGSFEGPAQLSTEYKNLNLELIRKKHGL